MQPLVLLCGLLCDEAIWGDIPARIADVADVQVISFGGLSSIEAMADRVLSAAPLRFALAGHSMGGRVALEAWRRAPERIAALGLLNSGAHPTRDAEYESRGALVRLARAQGMAALAAQWLPPLMGASPARIAQVMPGLTAMVERCTAESFAGQTNALLLRPDARPVLSSITVPTLLLSGTNDGWSSVAQHADMQQSVAHATLVEIAGAGHMAPIERPDAVARALRAWLSGLGGPPASSRSGAA
ncbi:MAG: alpha/beta fold hydrolase [Steroidobacteraceae bacterium]|jgi:pimeloyl-ACP methyl ester carboxylesterase